MTRRSFSAPVRRIADSFRIAVIRELRRRRDRPVKRHSLLNAQWLPVTAAGGSNPVVPASDASCSTSVPSRKYVRIVARLLRRSNLLWLSKRMPGVFIGVLNVAINFLNQFLHAAKCSPTNRLLSDAVEPDLHPIKPRGARRREEHVKSWSCCQPAFDAGMFVRAVVVHNDVHLQRRGHVWLGLP